MYMHDCHDGANRRPRRGSKPSTRSCLSPICYSHVRAAMPEQSNSTSRAGVVPPTPGMPAAGHSVARNAAATPTGGLTSGAVRTAFPRPTGRPGASTRGRSATHKTGYWAPQTAHLVTREAALVLAPSATHRCASGRRTAAPSASTSNGTPTNSSGRIATTITIVRRRGLNAFKFQMHPTPCYSRLRVVLPKTEKFYFEGDADAPPTDYASAARIKSPWNERGAIAGGCVDRFDDGSLYMFRCHDGPNRNATPSLRPSTSRLGCSAKVLTRSHPVAGAEKFYFSSSS